MQLVQVNYPRVLDEENGAPLTTRRVKMANSSTHNFGGFIDPFTGTDGAQTFAANQNIRGVVVDILTYVNGAYTSVAEINNKGGAVPGTFTALSGNTAAKYQTTSTNVTKAFPDVLVYHPIAIDSFIEATIVNSSGVAVNRGTTATSAVINNFCEPQATFNWAIDEAGVNASATGLNFQIVGVQPRDTTKVLLKIINANGAVS